MYNNLSYAYIHSKRIPTHTLDAAIHILIIPLPDTLRPSPSPSATAAEAAVVVLLLVLLPLLLLVLLGVGSSTRRLFAMTFGTGMGMGRTAAALLTARAAPASSPRDSGTAGDGAAAADAVINKIIMNYYLIFEVCTSRWLNFNILTP
jgi:hypothetical protein